MSLSNYFARLHLGPRAVAEDLVHAELQKRGLNRHLTTNRDIFLTASQQSKFGTPHINVDFFWSWPMLALFLDGPHHKKSNQSAYDLRVDGCLKHLGYKVLRVPYDPPIGKKEVKRIVDEVEGLVKQK